MTNAVESLTASASSWTKGKFRYTVIESSKKEDRFEGNFVFPMHSFLAIVCSFILVLIQNARKMSGEDWRRSEGRKEPTRN